MNTNGTYESLFQERKNNLPYTPCQFPPAGERRWEISSTEVRRDDLVDKEKSKE